MLKKIIACFAFAMLGVFALVGSNCLEDSKREPLNKKDIVLDDDDDDDETGEGVTLLGFTVDEQEEQM